MGDTTKTASGQCLCGAIAFRVTLRDLDVGVCHCGMCRLWTAGTFMALECKDIRVERGDGDLGVYRSSEWGERCFCKSCGTSLFWRMQDGSIAAVSVHALELDDAPRLATEIFIDEKPDFYAFANDTRKMTGAEVIALATGVQDR